MTVLRPVPPEVPAKALTRLRVVMVDEEMVVVARVEVPEIARVPVAVRLPPKKPLPATVRRLPGVVVPIPTLPAFVIRIRSVGFVPPSSVVRKTRRPGASLIPATASTSP